MKKTIVFICLITIITLFSLSALAIEPQPNAKEGLSYEYTPKEGSIEELYKDIIASLITPYISKSVQGYYGHQYLFDLSSIKFLRIERPMGYRSFLFIIKVQIMPFIGAHNVIGIDNVTIRIEGQNTKVEKFEHIKNFPIPEYLR
jgi:hypothetical protein